MKNTPTVVEVYGLRGSEAGSLLSPRGLQEVVDFLLRLLLSLSRLHPHPLPYRPPSASFRGVANPLARVRARARHVWFRCLYPSYCSRIL